MKLVSLIFCLMLVVGCSPTAPEVITEQIEVTRLVETEVTRVVEIPIEVTRLVEVEVTRVVAPTATPRPPATATPEAPEIGTRNNPVPVLTPADLVITANSGRQSVTFTVTDIVRGDEALQMARSANMYNDPPTEGNEFLLALIEIAYLEGDGVMELGRHDTALVSNNRIIEFGDMAFEAPCCIKPEFDFQLFPDATANGWLPFMVPVDDVAPLLLIGDPIDGIYFSLVE